MSIRFRSEQIEALENAYSDMLKRKKADLNAINTIESVLRLACNKNFKYTVVECGKNTPFWGMSVQPEESYTQSLIDATFSSNNMNMIKTFWDGITNWEIRVDERLISDTKKPFTARELTVMTLHEVGHITQTNGIPERIKRVVSFTSGKMLGGLYQVVRSPHIKNLLRVPINNACSTSRHVSKEQVMREIKADSFAIDATGYDKELISAMNKVIEKQPKVDKSVDSDMEDIESIKKVIENIELRKSVIDSPFKYTFFRFPKDERVTIESMLSIENDRTYDLIREEVEFLKDNEDEFMYEFFDFIKKRLKPIDMSYVRFVLEKLNDIESEAERSMLIEFLEGKISMIDWYVAILRNPDKAGKYVVPQTEKELIDVKINMERAIATIKKHIIKDKYNIRTWLNIQLPPEYQS